MRTIPKGKWNVRITDSETGKRFVLTWDGYKTKTDAQKQCEIANKIDNGRYSAEIIKW